METQKIEKSIYITASKENVWRVLTEDFYTRQWFAEFSEGTYAKGDLQEGGKVMFLDTSGSGIVAKVAVLKPQQELVYEYTSMLKNEEEDYESDDAKMVMGGRESYYLSDKNGLTHLATAGDMAPAFIEMMSGSWDRAIEKIRMLAEMLEVQ